MAEARRMAREKSGCDRRERTVPSVLNGQSVLFYHHRSDTHPPEEVTMWFETSSKRQLIPTTISSGLSSQLSPLAAPLFPSFLAIGHRHHVV